MNPSASEPKEVITTKELLSWLEIGRTSLHRLRKKGIITAYKLNGKLYFKRSEIIAAIEAGKQEEDTEELIAAA